jgi:hypothetical protein
MNVDQATVVVAVDDSTAARSALLWAAARARLCGAPLEVVHAFQPRHLAGLFGMAKLQPDAEWRADAQQWLSGVGAARFGELRRAAPRPLPRRRRPRRHGEG